MRFTKSFAALIIVGLLPLAAASAPARAKVFDWSLTGPDPSLGGFALQGSGTITASPTGTNVWDIDAITGTVNGDEITGTSTFEGADNMAFTTGLPFSAPSGSPSNRCWKKCQYC